MTSVHYLVTVTKRADKNILCKVLGFQTNYNTQR